MPWARRETHDVETGGALWPIELGRSDLSFLDMRSSRAEVD